MELSFNFISPQKRVIKRKSKHHVKLGSHKKQAANKDHYAYREPLTPYKRKDGWIIKNENGKCVPYSRWYYQHYHNVKLDPSEVVKFKDGNKWNVDIDNLIITTRKDVLRENYDPEKMAKTLSDKWRRQKLRLKVGLPPIMKIRTDYTRKNAKPTHIQ